MIEPAEARGRELFNSGFYCAESVLLGMAEHLGIQSELIPGIASGFCSGIARSCGQCGALSGAILGLGLIYGRKSPQDSMDIMYRQVQRLLVSFRETFGSTNCRELTGVDLGSVEGQRQFREQGKHALCADITGRTLALALKIADT